MRESQPDPFDAQIGARIKAARLARGLSLAALGDAAGVSFQQVQKYEAGLYRVSASTLRRIAGRLEVTAGHLFGEDEAAAPAPANDAIHPLLAAWTAIRDPVTRDAILRLAQAAADGHRTASRQTWRDPGEPRSFAAE